MNKKKHIITLVVLAVLTVFIACLIPKKIKSEFVGIVYSLNDNSIFEENYQVKFIGNYYNNFLLGKRFNGEIFVNDEIINLDNKDIKINFSHNRGTISQTFYNQTKNLIETVSYGTLFINNEFSIITMTIDNFNQIDNNTLQYSAPADDIDSAIKIYFELTK